MKSAGKEVVLSHPSSMLAIKWREMCTCN